MGANVVPDQGLTAAPYSVDFLPKLKGLSGRTKCSEQMQSVFSWNCRASREWDTAHDFFHFELKMGFLWISRVNSLSNIFSLLWRQVFEKWCVLLVLRISKGSFATYLRFRFLALQLQVVNTQSFVIKSLFRRCVTSGFCWRRLRCRPQNPKHRSSGTLSMSQTACYSCVFSFPFL